MKVLDVITLKDGRKGTIVDESEDSWLVEVSGKDGVPVEFVKVSKHGG